MGSDEAKIEKKRLKAEQKAKKKAAKAEEKEDSQPVESEKQQAVEKPAVIESSSVPVPQIQLEPIPQPKIVVEMPHVPWYKDPRWISAIIGAVSLSLALISIFTDWL